MFSISLRHVLVSVVSLVLCIPAVNRPEFIFPADGFKGCVLSLLTLALLGNSHGLDSLVLLTSVSWSVSSYFLLLYPSHPYLGTLLQLSLSTILLTPY